MNIELKACIIKSSFILLDTELSIKGIETSSNFPALHVNRFIFRHHRYVPNIFLIAIYYQNYSHQYQFQINQIIVLFPVIPIYHSGK